jgi:hypothetical protein
MHCLRSQQKRDRETEHLQLRKTAKFDETLVGWASWSPEKYNYDFYELKLMNL